MRRLFRRLWGWVEELGKMLNHQNPKWWYTMFLCAMEPYGISSVLRKFTGQELETESVQYKLQNTAFCFYSRSGFKPRREVVCCYCAFCWVGPLLGFNSYSSLWVMQLLNENTKFLSPFFFGRWLFVVWTLEHLYSWALVHIYRFFFFAFMTFIACIRVMEPPLLIAFLFDPYSNKLLFLSLVSLWHTANIIKSFVAFIFCFRFIFAFIRYIFWIHSFVLQLLLVSYFLTSLSDCC